MKFCSFFSSGKPCFGVEVGPGRLIDLRAGLAAAVAAGLVSNPGDRLLSCCDLKSWFSAGAAGMELAAEVRRLAQQERIPGVVARNQTRLTAPIPNPGKIICVGLNYRKHAEEQGAPIPERPILFSKFPSAIIGPEEPIKLPLDSNQVDAEAELCAVVLETGRNLSKDSARGMLAFTVGNDVSARDFQYSDRQWVRAKSCDTFAPMGPFVVTADELGDPHGLRIECRWNDQLMQSSNTSDLIFDSYHLVEFITRYSTLEPGDIIFTGTPSGVGMFHEPQVFLKPGDQVEVTIEKIGALRNAVVAG